MMHSGGVLGGQAEIAKSTQTHSLASESFKIEGMSVKSCVLGVLDGQAETANSKHKHPLASKSCKIEGILVKLSILEGFWAASLKPRKVSKSVHWFQNQIKLKEC